MSLDVGFGPDSAFLEFNTGLSLRPTPHFWMRLGYRMIIMGLVDRAEELDERSLGFTAGGPGIELGLEF